MLSVCADDGLWRSRVVHRSGGEAVAGFGGPFDASCADELLEGGADGRVSSRDAFADLSLRERFFGFGEDVDDTLLSGLLLRHGFVGNLPAQAQSRPLTVVGKFDLDVVEAGSGAMLDGQGDVPLSSAQVQVAVAPCMELGRPAKRLAGARGGAFARVMDEHHGGVEASLEISQERQDGGDVGDGVLVDAVQTHQGVEDEQAGPDTLDGVEQALSVVVQVEAQDRDVDDGDVEVSEGRGGGAGDAFEARAHDVPGVLGGEQHDGSGTRGGEVSQGGDG